MRSFLAHYRFRTIVSATALLLLLASCGTGSNTLPAQVGLGHRVRSASSTSRSYSIDLESKRTFTDWPLAALNVDLEEIGELGSNGWKASDAAMIHSMGGPPTSLYSDLSYTQSGEKLYNDISAYSKESDWQHITTPPTGCGITLEARVLHKSVYSNPNVSMTDVASVYSQDVISQAQGQDNAIFYDGTADWHLLNGPPYNPATGTDWIHYDFAHQLVGAFLNSETNPSTPFFVNENGEVQTSPIQAADTVRAMIGVSILGVKVEATNQLSQPATWQSFEDDELLGAQQGWKTVWEYDAFADGTNLNVRMQGIASVLLTYYDGAGVWWDYKTNSGFAVMPEAQIVPTNPVVAEPVPATNGTGNPVATLRAGSAGYGREYHDCFVGNPSVDKGPCAVFVTLNASSTWPYSNAYTHTLVLHGTDIADLGYVTTDGPAPGATIAASTGVIAFQN